MRMAWKLAVLVTVLALCLIGQAGTAAAALNLNHMRAVHFTGNYGSNVSGIKTAVLYMIRKMPEYPDMTDQDRADIAYEFEQAATDVLAAKMRQALDDTSAHTIILGGGVSAPRLKRKRMRSWTRSWSSTKDLWRHNGGL